MVAKNATLLESVINITYFRGNNCSEGVLGEQYVLLSNQTVIPLDN